VERTPLPKSDGLRASTSYSGDTAHCPCVSIIRSLCGRERGEITRESRVSGRCGAYGVRTLDTEGVFYTFRQRKRNGRQNGEDG